MDDLPIGALLGALVVLVLISAFFSAAEIAMVSMNRHRLRHLAENGHRAAQIAQRLLERPDRLIGVILLGSNSVNALFSALTTVTVIRLMGEDESAIGIATVVITLVILILTDLAPKTLSALHPERVALPSAWVLRPLLWLIYPVVWLVNAFANGLLRLFGVHVARAEGSKLSIEELRAIVTEAGALMPATHQQMLLAVLNLESITVEDVMVPRVEIEGVDLDADWDEVLERLGSGRYTRVLVYRGTFDNILGTVHIRKVVNGLRTGELTREALIEMLTPPYFVPHGTPLSTQLLNFRSERRRIALVVNEYGDVIGLVTLEEILEEIVGDFTAAGKPLSDEIQPQPDGSYLVAGNTALRDLNRRLNWELPVTGPKTLNGLITEYLEDIPQPGTSLILNGYVVDIVRVRGTAVQVARMRRHAVAGEASAGTG
jgi:Mg2+/Co2+ transporter CorB